MMTSTPAAPYLLFPFSPMLFRTFVFSLFDVLSFPTSPAPSQTLCSNHSLGKSKSLPSAGLFHNGTSCPGASALPRDTSSLPKQTHLTLLIRCINVCSVIKYALKCSPRKLYALGPLRV